MHHFRLMLLAVCSTITACSSPDPRACTPPRDYWSKPHNRVGFIPVNNVLALTHDGSIYWNGARVPLRTVDLYLRQSHTMSPEPVVFLEAEMGAPCRALEDLRNRMDKALECKKAGSRCEEGLRSVWDALPSPPGQKIS
jgi:hypothetical protein